MTGLRPRARVIQRHDMRIYSLSLSLPLSVRQLEINIYGVIRGRRVCGVNDHAQKA